MAAEEPELPEWTEVTWFPSALGRCQVYRARHWEMCGLCGDLGRTPWVFDYRAADITYMVCARCLPLSFGPSGERRGLSERLYMAATGLALWEDLGTPLVWREAGKYALASVE